MHVHDPTATLTMDDVELITRCAVERLGDLLELEQLIDVHRLVPLQGGYFRRPGPRPGF
jgi:hypothetical protein